MKVFIKTTSGYIALEEIVSFNPFLTYGNQTEVWLRGGFTKVVNMSIDTFITILTQGIKDLTGDGQCIILSDQRQTPGNSFSKS